MSFQESFEMDISTLKTVVDEFQRRMKEEEDPKTLNEYRKIFKKMVPFFMRGYLAGYLLQHVAQKGGVRRKMNTTTLFVSIGKNRRVYPRDLVQLFFAAGKIPKTDIGDIKILDNYSFVDVEEQIAAEVIRLMDGITYRGRRLTVNFAKKRPVEDAAFESGSVDPES